MFGEHANVAFLFVTKKERFLNVNNAQLRKKKAFKTFKNIQK